MTSGRYHERVRDLLADAEAQATRSDWDAVRDLAGAALALAPDSVEAQRLLAEADTASPSFGERRQITVMFCDVVGSTALSHHRDPEIVREVLRSYQAACDAVVRRYEGHIATYVGDGVLAYFGHPVAHEDDARRAVRAGLDLMVAIRPVVDEARERYAIDLSIRAAVHTGLVVRADMGSPTAPDRDAIVGETPNLAARLQDRAAPGTLVISGATYDLVRGWFLVVPRGSTELKGLDYPVDVYEVVEETNTSSRIEVQADLSPFVGRTAEVDQLVEAWDQVQAGGSVAMVISGEAGVGKSRLADVIGRRVHADDATTLITHCSSYHRSTALYPVRRLIERAAGIDPGHVPEHALSRLWTAMDEVGLAESLPYFADLLGLPPASWCPPPELDGMRLREELLSTLVRWIRASAEASPMLLVVDDVQWADATTVELIGQVVAQRLPGLLLVVTARDGFAVPWPGAQKIQLERFAAAELHELARRLPEGRALTAGHLERIVDRSDGVPLFLEELLRSSAMANSDADRASSIPPALRDLLLARFAVPGADLRLAQAIATIGVEARLPMIATASEIRSTDLDRQLAALVEAGVLLWTDEDPELYRFRHHLLADLAYDTQLVAARQLVHGRVADALLAARGGDAAVLAHHLEHATRYAEAVAALTIAADAAQALGAFDEAGELLDRAIELLSEVPADQRAEHEIPVRLQRGMNVASRLGYAAPQAVADFTSASALVAELAPAGYLDDESIWGDGTGPAGDRLWAITGLWATLMLQGQLDDCDAISVDLIAKVRPDGPMREFLEANRAFVSAFRGDFAVAERGLRRVAELLETTIDMPLHAPNPNDPGPAALAHLALVESVLGHLDDARGHSAAALAMASEATFPRGPFTYCYVSGMRTAQELLLGDIDAARRHAAEQVRVAERHGFTFWVIVAGLLTTMLEMRDGDPGAEPRAGNLLAMVRSLGVLVWLPAWYAEFGGVLLEQGELDLAETYLSTAAEIATETGAHFSSAEIARQRGEVRLARDPSDPAGLGFLREAVQISVDQHATLYELRARTALCATSDDSADHKALSALLDQVDVSPELAELAAARAVLRDPA